MDEQKNLDDYVVSFMKQPSIPAFWASDDEGESWDIGNYIAVLQKHPPLMIDVAEKLANKNSGPIPPSENKGIRYIYVMSLYWKKGCNPAGESSRPAEMWTIEQCNVGALLGSNQWDIPVLCAFTPRAHLNYGKNCSSSITREEARKFFFDNMKSKITSEPVKIGNIRDGMSVVTGKNPPSASGKGCLVPILLTAASAITYIVTM